MVLWPGRAIDGVGTREPLETATLVTKKEVKKTQELTLQELGGELLLLTLLRV